MTSESSLEARVAHVEGIVGQIDSCLARIETRLDESVTRLRREIGESNAELRREFNESLAERRRETADLRRKGANQFRTTIAMLLSMWVTNNPGRLA